MRTLSAVASSPDDLLGILYADPSFAVVQVHDECDDRHNKGDDNDACQHSHTDAACTFDELLEQVGEVRRHRGDDVDQEDDGDTVSDPLLRDLLTDPHDCNSACCEDKCITDDRPYILSSGKRTEDSLVAEADHHDRTFDQSQRHRQITGDLCDLLSSVFSFFLKLFQFRDRDRKKLDDDGRSNVYRDIQCEDRHA